LPSEGRRPISMAEQDTAPTKQTEDVRGRSTIEFPYLDLDDSVEVAKTIKEKIGTSCQREQRAGALGVSSTGGGFNLRLGTAKMFGLIAYERGNIQLTPLGIRITDAHQEKPARVEAFFKIPLYIKLYDKFKSTSLPPTAGLEGEIVTLGVAPKQKDKARQAFLRSAKQAGFFEFSGDRLILPAGNKATVERKEEKPPTNSNTNQNSQSQSSYPPFIQGLLEELPPAGGDWTKEERRKWLQLAALAFDLMYKDSGKTPGSITVEIGAVSSASTKP
jgi:hypothetical protein